MNKISYFYKGTEYKFFKYGKMKHPDTREWLLCVYYEDSIGNLYCRELKDFESKFKKSNKF